MNNIHRSAIIDPGAELGEGITIGPFCLVGKDVKLGDGCVLDSNVILSGNTTIGIGNRFFNSAVIGTEPQDLKYKGEPTELIIGDNNTIREFATINGSANLKEATKVGNNNLVMAYSHIAHNCQIGNNTILVNAVNLAGHVHIHDHAIIGGMTAVAQFRRIGTFAYVGGSSGVTKDIPPFTRGLGLPYIMKGINSVGLRRNSYNSEQIDSIRKIFKIFYFSGMNVTQAMRNIENMPLSDEQKIFVDFIKNSEVGISR